MKKKVTNNLKLYAQQNNVPIITDEGLKFILDQIKLNNTKTVLEIGTAIGYSAISFATNGCLVTSIERNEAMYLEAVKNVKDFELEDNITLIFSDALNKGLVNTKFDLIFIDAAKAQYEKFFNLYSKHLNDNGIIITDNLNFHNLDPNKVSRHTRQLIRKINGFKDFLSNNKDYKTIFYDVGDGMSVTKKND